MEVETFITRKQQRHSNFKRTALRLLFNIILTAPLTALIPHYLPLWLFLDFERADRRRQPGVLPPSTLPGGSACSLCVLCALRHARVLKINVVLFVCLLRTTVWERTGYGGQFTLLGERNISGRGRLNKNGGWAILLHGCIVCISQKIVTLTPERGHRSRGRNVLRKTSYHISTHFHPCTE